MFTTLYLEIKMYYADPVFLLHHTLKIKDDKAMDFRLRIRVSSQGNTNSDWILKSLKVN